MKYFLTLLLGLGVVSATACSSVETADVQQDQTFTLAIDGMTWGQSCVAKVQGALEEIPGVDYVNVDFANKTATVNASSLVSADMLVEALAEVNYPAKLK